MATEQTIYFAGGGSGGHIFPNIAVYERLLRGGYPVKALFLLSSRELDGRIAVKHDLTFATLPASPFYIRPVPFIRFLTGYLKSRSFVESLIRRNRPGAIVATGGYVSAPAIDAARRCGVPVAMVNLDAVPGKANRVMAGKADEVFTLYQPTELPRAERIDMPLRQSVLATKKAGRARWELGLRPDMETILVTAGSQGARSINQMMIELCSRSQTPRAFEGWQVIHLSGGKDLEAVRHAYQRVGIRSVVEPFTDQMGLFWSAATLAISRAGAGSVAEAWANAVPAIFLPYPYHKDQHQRFNAEPLVSSGAAMLISDLVDPIKNVNQLMGPLFSLMANEVRWQKMREILRQNPPDDGAAAIAGWLLSVTGLGAGGVMKAIS